MHDEEMDKLAITFKHLVIDVENQEPDQPPVEITVAHLADLMETLQSCLLKYWEYDPEAKLAKEEDEKASSSNNEDDSKPARRVAQLSNEEEKADDYHPRNRWLSTVRKMSTAGWLHRSEEKEAAKKEPKGDPDRVPARAYQFGNTIILEDEDGEVIKKIDIPVPPGKEAANSSSAAAPWRLGRPAGTGSLLSGWPSPMRR